MEFKTLDDTENTLPLIGIKTAFDKMLLFLQAVSKENKTTLWKNLNVEITHSKNIQIYLSLSLRILSSYEPHYETIAEPCFLTYKI